MVKATKEELAWAETYLKKCFLRNKVVWTKIESVSKSGMSRIINAYTVKNNEIDRVSYYVAQLLDSTYDDKTGGIRMNGSGMDMEFALEYNLSRKLYGDGYKLKKRSMP